MYFLNQAKSNSHYKWHYVHSLLNELPLGGICSAKYRSQVKTQERWGQVLVSNGGLQHSSPQWVLPSTCATSVPDPTVSHSCPPTLPGSPERPSKTISSSLNNRHMKISGEMCHLWEIWRLRWKKSESFSKSTSQQEDKRHEGTRWIGACIAQNSLCLLFSMEPQKQIPLPTSYFHICFAQIHQLLLIIFFLPLCICITIYNTNMHISAYVYTCTHFPKTIQNRIRDTFLYL